jgi:hypothetical protein
MLERLSVQRFWDFNDDTDGLSGSFHWRYSKSDSPFESPDCLRIIANNVGSRAGNGRQLSHEAAADIKLVFLWHLFSTHSEEHTE